MIAPGFRSRLGQPSSRLPIPSANELSTVEWQRARDAHAGERPAAIDLANHSDYCAQLKQRDGRSGIVQVDLAGGERVLHGLRQRVGVHLESHGECGRRAHAGANDLVNPERIRPECLVAEGVEAEDRLPLRHEERVEGSRSVDPVRVA